MNSVACVLFVATTLCGCSNGNDFSATAGGRFARQACRICVISGIDVSPEDRSALFATIYKALETGRSGQKFRWNSKRADKSCVVVPAKVYFDKHGCISRDFIYTTDEKRPKRLFAVRNESGIWQISDARDISSE
ncbi:MAG: hypothetical protein LBJ03_04305 [Holosporales bacterium]|jgi:surface antigen|nr:hypothetical protein [Holosporales bacterium]